MKHEEKHRYMLQGLLLKHEEELARLVTRSKLCINSIREQTIIAITGDPSAMDTEPLSIYVEDLIQHNKHARELREKISNLKSELGTEEK